MRHPPLWPRIAPGRVGRRRSTHSPYARVVAPAFIGRCCNVRRAAVVTRGSSLEHHSEVDCATVIDNSSVMPYTRVGAGLDVEYSVVGFHRYIACCGEVTVEIEDPRLIGATTTHFSARTSRPQVGCSVSCPRIGEVLFEPTPKLMDRPDAIGRSTPVLDEPSLAPVSRKRNPTRDGRRGDMETSRPVIVKRVPENLNMKQARIFLEEVRPLLDHDRPQLVFDFRWFARSTLPVWICCFIA